MNTLLILFFASLIGIMTMIGRKLTLARNGEILEGNYSHPFIPDFQNIKDITLKNTKRFGYVATFITIKYYVRSSNFLKDKYQEIKTKIKNRNKKSHIEGEKKEISKFLQIISDYKHKIRKIKHQIIEEEKN